MINLDSPKATMNRGIPTDILKSSKNIHLYFLTDIINKSFQDGEFPNALEYT